MMAFIEALLVFVVGPTLFMAGAGLAFLMLAEFLSTVTAPVSRPSPVPAGNVVEFGGRRRVAVHAPAREKRAA